MSVAKNAGASMAKPVGKRQSNPVGSASYAVEGLGIGG